MFDFDIVARIIGYHFWEAKSDEEAIECGSDVTKEIEKALMEASSHYHDVEEFYPANE